MASKLQQMQMNFQKRQMQEREEKLVKMYENQQQRAFDRVGRGSAGSSGSITTINTGKVRQMFDERRQKAGIDKSYPLEPLKNNGNAKTRAASLDRKPVPIKTMRPSVTKTSALRQTERKTITMGALYNNNNNYEDETFGKDQEDLVRMMNNHNLDLEDEEIPQIGFVDYDIFRGKLANIGGKLPSQKLADTRVLAEDQVKPVAPVAKKRTPNGVPPKKPVLKTSSSKSVKETSPVTTPTKTMKSASSPTSGGTPNTTNRTPNALRNATKPVGRPMSSNVQRDDLSACRYCQRRFATDRIQTHEDICSRTGKKKRKVFDVTKHRLEGTELEPYAKKATKVGKQTKPVTPAPSNKGNWRQKHEEFIAAIRAAKMAQQHIAKGGNIRDLPPPPPSSNPDYVQCPHCGRRFNEQAAGRHIPKCANYQFNKPKPSARK